MANGETGTRYDHNVIIVAVSLRHMGRPWKEIKEEIGRRFGVRPSVRQMQNWQKLYGQGPLAYAPAYLQRLFSETRHKLVKNTRLFVDHTGPVTGQLLELGATSDGVTAFLMATLAFLETLVQDRKYFDRAIDGYREWRDKLSVAPIRMEDWQ